MVAHMTSGTSILRGAEIADERFSLRSPRSSLRPAQENMGKAPPPTGNAHGGEPDADITFQRNPSGALQRAEEEARQMGFEAGHEAGRREGYDAGFTAGKEAGLLSGDAEGREAYTAGLRQLEDLAQSLNRNVELSLSEAEDMVVSIVFESVCKIVGDALTTKDGVAAVVREAINRTRGKSALVIRVNPFDLELIEESAAFGIASEADWRGDDSVTMGGCMIDSEYGTLDARIDVQLNQLKRALLAARHKPVDDLGGE